MQGNDLDTPTADGVSLSYLASLRLCQRMISAFELQMLGNNSCQSFIHKHVSNSFNHHSFR